MSQEHDPTVHRRRSIRLAGYDYSEEGWYFITICAQCRHYMFGRIIENQMQSNDAGTMIATWWHELSNKFPLVQTDEYIVMPNHFHGIVFVGAALCGRPGVDAVGKGSGQPHRVAPTLGDVVNWFKTMTTNQYIRSVKADGWSPFSGKLWQRNYYEHIIRDEEELNYYRAYIAGNPANWQTDEENPDTVP